MGKFVSRTAYYSKRIAAFYLGNWRTDRFRGVARLSAALVLTALSPVSKRLGPRRRECPCCGWGGAWFLPFLATGYVTFDAICPRCASAGRHRAHRIFYKKLFQGVADRADLLYFAPEESNLGFLSSIPGLKVFTSSYPSGPTDFHFDILDMPVEDGRWDYIICHRVIEHLSDDKRGMREFFRILKPGGTAVLSVPIDLARPETVEYVRPNDLENEHYYYYGTDFVRRIPAEFETQALAFSDTFTTEEIRLYSLPDDYLFVCRKPGLPGS